jgi:hypothetical protein
MTEKMASVQYSGSASEIATESFIENSIIRLLNHVYAEDGESFYSQVRCDIGIVDLLSDYTIIEVKRVLDRSSIIRAIGQLQIYSVFFPDRQKVIAGLHHDDVDTFAAVLGELGIKIMSFKEFEINMYYNHL